MRAPKVSAGTRRFRIALGLAVFLGVALQPCLRAQSAPGGTTAAGQAADPPSAATPPGSGRTVDGVAARIEDDILTESELRELAAFQKLVDGQEKPRDELLRELADQWIIRSEATTTKFPRVSPETLTHVYDEFVKQFGSPEEFKRRREAVGLSEPAVKRLLEQQAYLSRFLDYRFRPSAQVDDKQIETYYREEFERQLKSRNEPVPPLEDVEETIHEVLVQRLITERANQWLNEARDHLRIDIVSQDRPR